MSIKYAWVIESSDAVDDEIGSGTINKIVCMAPNKLVI
jgi:hypothetical protein